MTPTQILASAKNKYNAVGDTFFSEAELLDFLFEACLDMAKNVPNLIEATYSTSTVANQQDYSYPTNTVTIKRITYAGQKLKPITMREDDSITGLDQSTTSTGTPQYYFIFNETISLRPIPSAVATLKIYSYNEPSSLVIGSSLEIPTQFHMDLVNFMVSAMAAKDSNLDMAIYYDNKWQKAIADCKKVIQRRKRGDSFNTVQDEDSMIEGYLGVV